MPQALENLPLKRQIFRHGFNDEIGRFDGRIKLVELLNQLAAGLPPIKGNKRVNLLGLKVCLQFLDHFIKGFGLLVENVDAVARVGGQQANLYPQGAGASEGGRGDEERVC